MLVVAVVALASALVVLSLPDQNRGALARDGERLAALLESARAQSRATGLPVIWRPTDGGFRFDGLPASAPALPTHWLSDQTFAADGTPVVLGPEPIIAPQQIELRSDASGELEIRIATNGLAPFHVEAAP